MQLQVPLRVFSRALAALFTAGAMLTGILPSRFVAVDDQRIVVIERAVRNIPVAILIASSVAANSVFAGFVAAYFLIEVLVMVRFSFG